MLGFFLGVMRIEDIRGRAHVGFFGDKVREAVRLFGLVNKENSDFQLFSHSNN